MRTRHGCHTAILYGSHASRDAAAGSDYDVAGFAAVSKVRRIAGPWRSSYLDVFIHPEARLASADRELLAMRGGVVLFERDGAGTSFLKSLEELHARGPEPLGEDERKGLGAWAWKMLDRAGRGDAEGDYRRAWLLYQLLEDYFLLRDEWYPGPKKGLAWLAVNAPGVRAAFDAALRPGASLEAIAQLVEAVAGPRDVEWAGARLLSNSGG